MAAPAGNKYAIGNTGGRPPAYESTEELSAAIDEYFIYIQGEKGEQEAPIVDKEDGLEIIKEEFWIRMPEPATVTGLFLFLGFSSRSSLDDYEKRSEEFSLIIKRARARVEHNYELKLHGDKPTGAIFALKNMGWRDKVETGFTDGEGKDLPHILQFKMSPGCEPLNEGLANEQDQGS